DALKGYIGGYSEESKVYIPNVIKEVEKDESLGTGDGDALDNLHIKINSSALKEKNNTAFAVGDYASRFTTAVQGSAQDRKGESDQTLILILAALAYDAVVSNKFKVVKNVVEAQYLLSTGLPIDESKKKGARKNFANKLKEGTHEVEFLETPGLKGIKVQITFADVYVNSEGHAAMVNLTVDDDFKPRNSELKKQKVLLDDMGGITTDLAVIVNNVIDDENSDGIPLGISETLDEIIRKVYSEHRYRFKTRRDLVKNITREENPYIVRPQVEEINIKETVDKELRKFAEEQFIEIKRMWTKISDLDVIVCVGGTAYLLKEFIEEFNEGINYPIIFADSAEESIWSIAKAYYKLLIVKAKKAGYTDKELALTA
ncbi:ParM/StbA family protein, partial [Salmonella enterica subsp. enterica]|nr:ParM/StbA family protein [Salmonella enterica subsp. enterica serovar Paratyphi A]